MILHLLRMRRNGNRNVFNDRKNVSATAFQHWAGCLPSIATFRKQLPELYSVLAVRIDKCIFNLKYDALYLANVDPLLSSY